MATSGTDLDPYRITCPNGHASWEPVDGHFWCQQCANHDRWDSDGSFERVVDQRENRRLDRIELKDLEEDLERRASGD